MNLKLELNMATLKALLPVLRKSQAMLYGLLLVGVFGYTAYAINQALNVQAASRQTAVKELPKITFDKKTMDSLSKRNAVDDKVQLNLGTTDPF
jgi:hypothetical protein